MNIGDKIMVNDPMVSEKVPAEIIDMRIGADGNKMFLIKSVWGEAWRREDALEDSVGGLVND